VISVSVDDSLPLGELWLVFFLRLRFLFFFPDGFFVCAFSFSDGVELPELLPLELELLLSSELPTELGASIEVRFLFLFLRLPFSPGGFIFPDLGKIIIYF
jgi:hypothetical protein